jgi:hypothetical protein
MQGRGDAGASSRRLFDQFAARRYVNVLNMLKLGAPLAGGNGARGPVWLPGCAAARR